MQPHKFEWREDHMGNYSFRCCDKGQTALVHKMADGPWAFDNLLGKIMAEAYAPMRKPVRLDPNSVGDDGWKCFRTECQNPAQVKMGYCPECFKRKMNDPAPRPLVVTLCGSTRFVDAWQSMNLWLTLRGIITLSVGAFVHDDALGITAGQKEMLDELHKRKIDMASVVLILNVGGYIGDSTRSEIEYAEWHEKPVVYLEPSELAQGTPGWTGPGTVAQ